MRAWMGGVVRRAEIAAGWMQRLALCRHRVRYLDRPYLMLALTHTHLCRHATVLYKHRSTTFNLTSPFHLCFSYKSFFPSSTIKIVQCGGLIHLHLSCEKLLVTISDVYLEQSAAGLIPLGSHHPTVMYDSNALEILQAHIAVSEHDPNNPVMHNPFLHQ